MTAGGTGEEYGIGIVLSNVDSRDAIIFLIIIVFNDQII